MRSEFPSIRHNLRRKYAADSLIFLGSPKLTLSRTLSNSCTEMMVEEVVSDGTSTVYVHISNTTHTIGDSGIYTCCYTETWRTCRSGYARLLPFQIKFCFLHLHIQYGWMEKEEIVLQSQTLPSMLSYSPTRPYDVREND